MTSEEHAPAWLADPDAPLQCRLAIQPSRVRDVCIPLSGFANIFCAFNSPRLPGTGAQRRVRTSPPVLLPRHGHVALPGPGCTKHFTCSGTELLSVLCEEPLLVELWHHDKYTKDVFLGVATCDLSEVVSAGPKDGPAGRTSHRQMQTLRFVAPEEYAAASTRGCH